MPTCPSCAREIPEGRSFCGYCGASVAGPAPGAGQAPASAQPVPDYWVCPQCSVENLADAQFCATCGSPRAATAAPATFAPPAAAIAAVWYCAACGESNEAEARFCYRCGVPVGSAGTTGAAPAPAPRQGGSGGRWIVLAAAIAVAIVA